MAINTYWRYFWLVLLVTVCSWLLLNIKLCCCLLFITDLHWLLLVRGGCRRMPNSFCTSGTCCFEKGWESGENPMRISKRDRAKETQLFLTEVNGSCGCPRPTRIYYGFETHLCTKCLPLTCSIKHITIVFCYEICTCSISLCPWTDVSSSMSCHVGSEDVWYAV